MLGAMPRKREWKRRLWELEEMLNRGDPIDWVRFYGNCD
jgi:hypothetical protein